MKQGTSWILNPVIARMFKELNLIEQWGTGVRRTLPALREAGLLEYIISEKPNSRLQKYRLTEKGESVLEGGK